MILVVSVFVAVSQDFNQLCIASCNASGQRMDLAVPHLPKAAKTKEVQSSEFCRWSGCHLLPLCCHMQFGGSEAEILEKVSRLEKQVEDLANRLAVPTQDQVPNKKNLVDLQLCFLYVFFSRWQPRDQLSFGNLRIQSHTAQKVLSCVAAHRRPSSLQHWKTSSTIAVAACEMTGLGNRARRQVAKHLRLWTSSKHQVPGAIIKTVCLVLVNLKHNSNFDLKPWNFAVDVLVSNWEFEAAWKKLSLACLGTCSCRCPQPTLQEWRMR